MIPFLASWMVVMVAVPIAYSYRYILMVAMGLPILCLLPFCSEPCGIDTEAIDSLKVPEHE